MWGFNVFILLTVLLVTFKQKCQVSGQCDPDTWTDCPLQKSENKCWTNINTMLYCKTTCQANVDCGGTVQDTSPICRRFSDPCSHSSCQGTCDLRNSVNCSLDLYPNSLGRAFLGGEINPDPKYGDIIIYECTPGYTAPEVRRACSETGTWIYDLEFALSMNCTGKPCTDIATLPATTSASNNNAHPNISGQGLYPDTLGYECDVGYNQTGGSVGAYVCDMWGSSSVMWQAVPGYSDVPVCTQIVCLEPVSVANATQNYTAGTYIYGTAVEYICNFPFSNVGSGNGVRWCNEEGQWTVYDSLPVCEETCQDPPVVQNAQPNDTFPYPPWTTIHYVCEPGFNRTGGGIGLKQCNNNLKWMEISGTNSLYPNCTGTGIEIQENVTQAEVTTEINGSSASTNSIDMPKYDKFEPGIKEAPYSWMLGLVFGIMAAAFLSLIVALDGCAICMHVKYLCLSNLSSFYFGDKREKKRRKRVNKKKASKRKNTVAAESIV